MTAQARHPHRRRWVWPIWSLMIVSLLASFGLWIVHRSLEGLPGPIIGGVYVTGPAGMGIVVLNVASAAALATVAAILIARVPANRIGWVLGAMAAWMCTTLLLIVLLYSVASDPGDGSARVANWLGTWTFVPAVPSSLVLMIFPTGSLLSPRWRALPWLAGVGTAAWAITEATGERLGLSEELANPFANPDLLRVADVAVIAFLPALLGTVVSLVLRYRRSPPDVQAQIRWVALGGFLQVLIILSTWAADVAGSGDFPLAAVVAGLLSTLIVPITLSIAILRYRLYAIDHLVSRTASYAVLSVLLAAGFSGGVIGAQWLLGASSDLAVAGTTLALAALFDPIRRRLHRIMDRRFDRSRFDAQRVAERFAARARSGSVPDDLLTDLARTLQETLAPSSIGIWLRR